MSHPCDGHPCDHCYLCDVVGICCMTVAGTAPVAPAITDPDEALRQAIRIERRTVPSLADLVRLEGEPSSSPPPALLPAPPPISEPVFQPIMRGANHE